MSQYRDIEDAAAAWLMRKSEGLSVEEQSNLEAWLDASPEHKLAFWRLEYGWSQAGRLSALRSPDFSDERTGAAGAPRRRLSVNSGRRQLLALAASIVIAACIGLVAWPHADIFETEIGERQQVTLEDGSRLDLNTRTRLRASMSENEREAWLDEGEAYFSIAHDRARPFILHMGDRTVRVLGTRFIARRHGDEISVSVVEGRVSVDAGGDTHQAPEILTAGDVVTTEGDQLQRRREPMEEMDARLSWRGGQLVFDQVTLSSAVAEFNRYNHTQVQVTDPETGAILIGGTFEAGNVDAFARLLDSAYDLNVTRDGDVITISQ